MNSCSVLTGSDALMPSRYGPAPKMLIGTRSLSRIVADLLQHRDVDDLRRCAEQQRVAVRLRARHGDGADRAAAARAVLDHERLTELVARYCDASRAIMSVLPPGEYGTITRHRPRRPVRRARTTCRGGWHRRTKTDACRAARQTGIVRDRLNSGQQQLERHVMSLVVVRFTAAQARAVPNTRIMPSIMRCPHDEPAPPPPSIVRKGQTTRPTSKAEFCAYGLASTPPVIGRGAPLVVGNVIGKPRIERTARNAKACASSASARPAGRVRGLDRRGLEAFRPAFSSACGLRAPPPPTIQARGALRQMRHNARDRLDRQRRQRRRAIGDRIFRQTDVGEGKGVAVERFRRRQIEERMRRARAR